MNFNIHSFTTNNNKKIKIKKLKVRLRVRLRWNEYHTRRKALIKENPLPMFAIAKCGRIGSDNTLSKTSFTAICQIFQQTQQQQQKKIYSTPI